MGKEKWLEGDEVWEKMKKVVQFTSAFGYAWLVNHIYIGLG